MFADGTYSRREVDDLARTISARSEIEPRVGLVIGTGFAAYADAIDDRVDVPYASLPDFPTPCLPGHESKYVLGRIEGVPVIIATGKFPLLGGFSQRVPMLHVRLFAALGCDTLVYTNTVGAVTPTIAPGQFLVFTDHVNWAANPGLSPTVDGEWGDVLFDMADAYDPALRELVIGAAADVGETLVPGVYGRFIGAQFETPAEVRAVAVLGVDAVGGTTVEEVIAAKQLGLPILVLGYASNAAAGVAPFDNAQILGGAERDLPRMARLLDAVIRRLARHP